MWLWMHFTRSFLGILGVLFCLFVIFLCKATCDRLFHLTALENNRHRQRKTLQIGGGGGAHDYKHTAARGSLGACSPRNLFRIRCSEITSEAILDQNLLFWWECIHTALGGSIVSGYIILVPRASVSFVLVHLFNIVTVYIRQQHSRLSWVRLLTQCGLTGHIASSMIAQSQAPEYCFMAPAAVKFSGDTCLQCPSGSTTYVDRTLRFEASRHALLYETGAM